MTAPLQGKNSVAFSQTDFLYVWTMTGLGLLFNDPTVLPILLKPNEDAALIGAAVRESLRNSKELENDEFQKLFHSGEIQKNSEEWEKELILRYGYKSSKSIYTDLKKCTIHESEGNISFSPTLHYGLQAWCGMDDVEDVVVTSTSSDEEIGMALIEALSRCGVDQNLY